MLMSCLLFYPANQLLVSCFSLLCVCVFRWGHFVWFLSSVSLLTSEPQEKLPLNWQLYLGHAICWFSFFIALHPSEKDLLNQVSPVQKHGTGHQLFKAMTWNNWRTPGILSLHNLLKISCFLKTCTLSPSVIYIYAKLSPYFEKAYLSITLLFGLEWTWVGKTPTQTLWNR